MPGWIACAKTGNHVGRFLILSRGCVAILYFSTLGSSIWLGTCNHSLRNAPKPTTHFFLGGWVGGGGGCGVGVKNFLFDPPIIVDRSHHFWLSSPRFFLDQSGFLALMQFLVCSVALQNI